MHPRKSKKGDGGGRRAVELRHCSGPEIGGTRKVLVRMSRIYRNITRIRVWQQRRGQDIGIVLNEAAPSSTRDTTAVFCVNALIEIYHEGETTPLLPGAYVVRLGNDRKKQQQYHLMYTMIVLRYCYGVTKSILKHPPRVPCPQEQLFSAESSKHSTAHRW